MLPQDSLFFTIIGVFYGFKAMRSEVSALPNYCKILLWINHTHLQNHQQSVSEDLFPHILINTGYKALIYFVSHLLGTQRHLTLVLSYVALTPN